MGVEQARPWEMRHDEANKQAALQHTQPVLSLDPCRVGRCDNREEGPSLAVVGCGWVAEEAWLSTTCPSAWWHVTDAFLASARAVLAPRLLRLLLLLLLLPGTDANHQKKKAEKATARQHSTERFEKEEEKGRE